MLTISLPKQGLLILLLVAGAVTRLPALDHPREVVFDEVHFGKFISAYCCTHEYFFDIHPPHAKLLIAGMAALTDYDGSFPFETIGQKYPEAVPITALRLLPALAGAALPALVYLLARQLGASSPFAFVAGWLLLVDNALTVHSRLISLDSILLVATIGSLICYLAAARFGHNRWWLYIAAGALAGLAAGTKFTGLAALAVIGVIVVAELIQAWRGKTTTAPHEYILRGLIIVAAAGVVYGAGWALHFMLLTEPGPGNAFHQPDFSSPLLPAFINETIELHRTMLTVNYGLEATHPYASRWYTWLVMQRPIFYWQGANAVLYFLGNPLVWWGSTVLLLAAAFSKTIQFGQAAAVTHRKVTFHARHWIPAIAYGIVLLPLIRVPRALFLYHYLTPLVFALVIGALWLEHDVARPPTARRLIPLALILASGTLFLFFSPLTYGFAIPDSWHNSLFWFATWR